ncbi:MAG: DUF721 domain-containing protein [Nitrospirae bacterium]|nr:DUF721 domain-containing protein [Nitrospirota bacterium]
MKRTDSLLAPLLKNFKIEDTVRLSRIKSEWQNIFEAPVSLHTSPAFLKEGELLINVDSPVWLQQLSFYKEDIIKKLQGFNVRAVRLKLGRVLSEKKKDKVMPKRNVLTENEMVFINETTTLIHNHELRDSIRKAIEKSFVFKEAGGR